MGFPRTLECGCLEDLTMDGVGQFHTDKCKLREQKIEDQRTKHIGRLVVRFNSKYDFNKGNYNKPTRILGRELGIFVEFSENWADTGVVYWQESMTYEEMWLGEISFVDVFDE